MRSFFLSNQEKLLCLFFLPFSSMYSLHSDYSWPYLPLSSFFSYRSLIRSISSFFFYILMLFFCLFCFVYFFRAHELNQDHRCDCGFTSFIYFECAKVHKGQAGEVGFLLPLYGVPGIGLRLLILVARDFYLLRHLGTCTWACARILHRHPHCILGGEASPGQFPWVVFACL